MYTHYTVMLLMIGSIIWYQFIGFKIKLLALILVLI